MEPAKSGEVSNLGTPKNQKRCAQCRCKYSRCLRMYCECFASGVYCDGCNCINCYNRKENEADRKEAIDAVLKRNRSAFNRGSGSRSGASVQLSKTSPATLASPKAPYRAELSGSRQPQHVKDLCNDLVGVSVEAAKSFSEERQMVGDGAEVERDETLVGCDEDSKDCQRQQHAVREAADNAPSANTLYIEQERLVLSKFLGFLKGLLTKIEERRGG